MPSGDPVSVEVAKALEEVGITEGDLAALSIHGPAALNDLSKPNKLLAVLENGGQLRFHGVEGSKLIDLALVVGLKQLREDCLEEKLGGAVASQLLIPYRPLANERLLRRLELEYKQHVVVESLQNLVLEHRLAASRLIVKPEYFLYDKLRRLAVTYLPIKPQIRACFEERAEDSLRIVIKGFEQVLDKLASRGILGKVSEGYSPTERYVLEVLSKSSAFVRFSRDLDHIFRLYLNAVLPSPLEQLRKIGSDPNLFKPVKLPDPLEFIDIETALGVQPLRIDLGIRDFVEKFYGVEGDRVRVSKVAGVLNSAYVAEFELNGSLKRVFAKKYLNWTDFKWFAAWIWCIGVKNFSLMASIRMSNEIYFVNKLMELGFNTAEILHVNWPRKFIIQRYVDGVNLVEALERSKDVEEFRRIAFEIGKLLAEVHRMGICLGDCNPFSFIFAPDGRIFLVDLEQCSYNDMHSWDLAELLYYTSHYLKLKQVESFASAFAEGYLTVGDPENLIEALDVKYARALALLASPLTPIKLKEAIMSVVRR